MFAFMVVWSLLAGVYGYGHKKNAWCVQRWLVLDTEAGVMYLKSSRTPFKREVARMLALLTMP